MSFTSKLSRFTEASAASSNTATSKEAVVAKNNNTIHPFFDVHKMSKEAVAAKNNTIHPFLDVHRILDHHIQFMKESALDSPVKHSLTSLAVKDLKVTHRLDADYQGQCAELISATEEFRIEDTEDYEWLFNEVERESIELEVPLPAPRRPSPVATDSVTSRQRKRFGMIFQL
ncbi:hypothetical protein L218DRAFT_944788 [Marasmius fiardii PR-910]|nr:hypothetical protein L218DRAFT_944788 [Marasmius fiardii PR-910]